MKTSTRIFGGPRELHRDSSRNMSNLDNPEMTETHLDLSDDEIPPQMIPKKDQVRNDKDTDHLV